MVVKLAIMTRYVFEIVVRWFPLENVVEPFVELSNVLRLTLE